MRADSAGKARGRTASASSQRTGPGRACSAAAHRPRGARGRRAARAGVKARRPRTHLLGPRLSQQGRPIPNPGPGRRAPLGSGLRSCTPRLLGAPARPTSQPPRARKAGCGREWGPRRLRPTFPSGRVSWPSHRERPGRSRKRPCRVLFFPPWGSGWAKGGRESRLALSSRRCRDLGTASNFLKNDFNKG